MHNYIFTQHVAWSDDQLTSKPQLSETVSVFDAHKRTRNMVRIVNA